MLSDVLSNAEYKIARRQSEHPDIYDAYYNAIEQLKAVRTHSISRAAHRIKTLAMRRHHRIAQPV